MACTTLPAQTMAILEPLGTVYDLGSQFGTVAVHIEGMDYELTTLRGETYTPGSRHPTVSFDASLLQDLARRDFTIGAMAAHHDGSIIDPFGGAADLHNGVIRCVGNPSDRFNEDPLRIVRALRFASLEPRTIHPNTANAMRIHAEHLSMVSRERITAETLRVIHAPDAEAFDRFITISQDLGLQKALFTTSIPNHNWSHCSTPASRLGALTLSGVDLFANRYTKAEHDLGQATAQAATSTSSTSHKVREYPDNVLTASNELRKATGKTPIIIPTEHTRNRLRAPLPINGTDLTNRGLQGKQIGEALTRVQTMFVTNKGHLSKQQALAAALDNP